MSIGSGTRRTAAFVAIAALCAAGLLTLAGCAMEHADWTKPGASTSELRRDLADCEREATGPGPFHFWALNETYETARDRIPRVRNECMEAKGWQPARRIETR